MKNICQHCNTPKPTETGICPKCGRFSTKPCNNCSYWNDSYRGENKCFNEKTCNSENNYKFFSKKPIEESTNQSVEELAEVYWNNCLNQISKEPTHITLKDAFIAGYKKASESLYSEEEVLEFSIWLQDNYSQNKNQNSKQMLPKGFMRKDFTEQIYSIKQIWNKWKEITI